MADEETRLKHSFNRKRNFLAKEVRTGENKGAFALKVVNPKKQEYKRVKMRTTENYEEDDN
jgi:hypothetical protein